MSRKTARPTTVVDRVQATLVEHRRELAFIGLLCVELFAVVSLAGWRETDPTWLRPDVRGAPVYNPGGPLGANVADLLYRAFGYGAWALIGSVVVPVYGLARRPLPGLGRAVLIALMGVLTLGVLDLALADGTQAVYPPGGAVGASLVHALIDVIGVFGAWLALLGGLLAGGSVLFQVSWRNVATAALDAVEVAWPVVRGWMARGAGVAASGARSGGALIGAGAVGVARGSAGAAASVGGALVGGMRAAGGGAVGLAGQGASGVRGLFVRMWQAITVGTALPDDDPSTWDTLSPTGGVGMDDGLDAAIRATPIPGLTQPTASPLTDATAAAEDPTRYGGLPVRDGETHVDAREDLLDRFPDFGPRRPRVAPAPVRPEVPARVEVGLPAARQPTSGPAPADVLSPAEAAPQARVAPPASRPTETVPPPRAEPSAAPPVEATPVSPRPDLPPPRPVEVPQAATPARPAADDVPAVFAPAPTRAEPVVRPPPVVVNEDEDFEDDDEESWDKPAPPVAPWRPATPAPGMGELHVEKAEGLERQVVDDGGAVADRSTLYFELPPLSLLDPVPEQHATIDEEELRALAITVEESLASFKVTGKVVNVRVGPVVTTFEFLPDSGISVRRIHILQDDLAMALRALSVRVVAPIPGKGVVGIEIPSSQRMTIYLRELLASEEFRNFGGALPVILGKDVEGRPMVADLAKMPHLLVGGTTGSGKSVGVNGMLMSLLFTRTPEELRLLLVDPKKLEFEAYADVPHLLHPVVTEAKAAAAALAWCCREMDRRYELLARWGTRNISSYNKKVERESRAWTREKARLYAPRDWPDDVPPPQPETLPYIVIVIDELADLMLVAKKDVQDHIVRLAQMARACGMHLMIATQRPSVDVVTGLIKSNLPTRMSFKLRSVIDSRTILDQGGAEKLLGNGDMLYLPGAGEVQRCHGPFVSDDECGRVIGFLKEQREPEYIASITAEEGEEPELIEPEEHDDLYEEAVQIVMRSGKASTSMVQRHLKIGYNRAARIIDMMESAGVVGPADGARPREVLVGPHANG